MANESKTENTADTDTAAKDDIIKKNGKTYVKRKELPSVQHLLAHGDAETAHLPKTWCEIIGYPLALAVVFAISLLMLHHAHHNLLPPRKKYSIPGMQRLPMFKKDGKLIPPLHRHPAARVAEAKNKAPEEEEMKSEL